MSPRKPTERQATYKRQTTETAISAQLNVDGTGKFDIKTGSGFLTHMLEQLACHSLIDMAIQSQGDVHIDDHHMVEDTAIVLGRALSQALGERRSIRRYASIMLPMDETLTRAALDVSGRPFLVFRTQFSAPKIGNFDTELVREWFQAFAINAAITLHIETLYGSNNHHIAESCFKALAYCLREALALDQHDGGMIAVPSTKGQLGEPRSEATKQ